MRNLFIGSAAKKHPLPWVFSCPSLVCGLEGPTRACHQGPSVISDTHKKEKLTIILVIWLESNNPITDEQLTGDISRYEKLNKQHLVKGRRQWDQDFSC